VLDDEISARNIVANRYSQMFLSVLDKNGSKLVKIPYVEAHNISAWAQYTIEVSERENLQEKLKKADIPTAVHYPIPLNRQPAVADVLVKLPVGDSVAEHVMSLPMHPYLDGGLQVSLIGNLIELGSDIYLEEK
jgi:UDP-2-acetamido-2-deoxy-ribo-hexuluronate aminotransferase